MAESMADPTVQQTIITGMSGEFAGAATMRTRRMDQLAEDASSMWSIAMTTPTVLAAKGIRTMDESGSGRTRAETNAPFATAAGGGTV